MTGSIAGASRRGEVITFYSFKGGVGRSMALANVAALYAQRGKRVLVLDFDFEAPGLHRYFLTKAPADRYTPAAPQQGVLNYFAVLRDQLKKTYPEGKGIEDSHAQPTLRAMVRELLRSGDYLYQVRLKNPSARQATPVEIDFIAAARFDATYPDLVRTFDWQGFYDDYAEVFPAIASELTSQYDFVLIDSRTGVTDIGSLCTMVLPDKLVLAFTPNEQSLTGALDAGWQAVQGRKEAPEARSLPIFPLLSRVEEGEHDLQRDWIARIRLGFERLFREAYGKKDLELKLYFDIARIPHRSFYAYGEQIAAEEHEATETGSLTQALSRFAECLSFEDVEEAQRMLAGRSGNDSESLLRAMLKEVAGRGKVSGDADSPTELVVQLIRAGTLVDKDLLEEALELYRKLVAQCGDATTGVALDILISALSAMGNVLAMLDRHEESLVAYGTIVERVGGSASASLRLEGARARYNMGVALGRLGRHEDGIHAYDDALGRFEKEEATPIVREGLARGLAAKASALNDLDRAGDALGTIDRLVRQFDSSVEQPVLYQVARVLVTKGSVLAKLGRIPEALGVRDEVIRRFGDSTDLDARVAVAKAFLGKAGALSGEKRHEEALATCENALRRFEGSTEPELLESVARLLLLKGIELTELQRLSEALDTFDVVIARFGDAISANQREEAARALFLKGGQLQELGRHEEAVDALTEMVQRFGKETTPSLHNFVANTAITKIDWLNRSEHFEEALRECEDFVDRFWDSRDPMVRKNAYGTLVLKAYLLTRLSRYDEAAVAYDHADARLCKAAELEARNLLPRVLDGSGFALLCKAKRGWQHGDETQARRLLEEASAKFTVACGHLPENPYVLGNAAYAAFLLGREDEARGLLTRAVALGGATFREAELKDTDIHSLPQDEAFRALVRSIPDPPVQRGQPEVSVLG